MLTGKGAKASAFVCCTVAAFALSGSRPVAAQSFTEFPLPTHGSGPTHITAGPDGAMWFTEPGINKIGRITTAGDLTEFPIPTPDAKPYGISAGPDGNLW